MFNRAKKAISIFFIGLLYAAFFVVQIFFNIGSSFSYISNLSDTHLSVKHNSNKDKVTTISNNDHSNKTTSNIRLNKRFHPESMPSLEFTVYDLPDLFASTSKISKPKDYLLIASILADSLRGPPVVA